MNKKVIDNDYCFKLHLKGFSGELSKNIKKKRIFINKNKYN